MVSQIQSLTQPEIIYPDRDGQPVANNTKQFHWILVIQQNLDWLFALDPNVFVAGDLFWYPVEGRNTIVNAPDVMVVFGRPADTMDVTDKLSVISAISATKSVASLGAKL